MGKPKILAINLPAFHRTKENDEWWGEGFTEWNNVKCGEPLFDGHVQPVHPINNYYYDLSRKEDLERQMELAADYGVYGMIFYHYWFGGGKMMLEKPMEILLNEVKSQTKYCFCWANESWRATWHGKEPKTLMRQTYPGREDWKKHLEYLLPFFKDERYIRRDNKPMLFIYKPNEIKDYAEMLAYFDAWLRGKGFDGIYIVEYVSSKNRGLSSMKSDAVTEFEPLYTTFFDISKLGLLKRALCKKLGRLDLQSYDKLWDKIIKRKRTYGGKPIMRGCFVGWDNSPRKGRNSMVVKGASPEKFKNNLARLARQKRQDADEYIVVNAWNEWSEGAFLEPSEEYGYGYLEAIKDILAVYEEEDGK